MLDYIPDAAPAAPPAPTASELMSRRLDRYLPTLQSDHARRAFLVKLEANLRAGYGHFLRTGEIATHVSFSMRDEFDFSLSIIEVNDRIGRLPRAEAA